MLTYLMAAVALAIPDTVINLDAVTVSGTSQHSYMLKSSQSSVQVSNDYINSHFSGSLMQTLEKIPGVKAMSIGSGQSKPAIRGLGFNRMVVAEDGIKHEGQQWGDDHGLEIDQFSVDRVEVLKGPGALLYGSDAIGGVINLYTNHIPTSIFGGTVQMVGRSLNDQLGVSTKIGGRHNAFFYRAHITINNYADSRVPTDSIQYYSYYIKLHDGRLRNTAGHERDGSLMLGYAGYNFHTDVRFSDTYVKSGFFANAHGLEVRLSGIDYDHSARDIDLPYQWVNHFKVQSHSMLTLADDVSLNVNIAYQRNVREEHSEPVSHGYMPTPQGSLERRFDKDTYTAALSLSIPTERLGQISMGANAEHQHNKRDGWGFIIPEFRSTSAGVYLHGRWPLAWREGNVNAGVRFDHSHTHIMSYNDWYRTPTANGDSAYTQRSADQTRRFNSLTWSVGVSRAAGHWVLKANVGKSFRTPIPKELGADGINYHIFRYEKGNSALSAERSYQIDASIIWSNDIVSMQIDPFFNYFPNYIYLSPTADYTEGLQLYRYMQSRVVRYGCEGQLTCQIGSHWEAELMGEYLYAEQMSGDKKGYTLPFSTPWSASGEVRRFWGADNSAEIILGAHLVGKQGRIVPPEKTTDGHMTLNASVSKRFNLGKHISLKATLHADNLLNECYYDHTSYYRLIDVPEAGRNFSASIKLTIDD
ncbi:MAG: TonB-dependent receptor [Bacteroidales bacterium]|nr:TonB-dependent receptor [Bacteroidales bacterium]